ncbi:hypothetical protein R6Q59_004237 [Mikania micrantha]
MEAMNSDNHFNIMLVIVCQLVPEIESVLREMFGKFNFREESGLLQFWACRTDPDSEEIGCNLVLTHLTCNPTQDLGLEDYRKRCLEKQYPFIGIETCVGNWLAGRAVQTGIADHRTIHHVVDQDDQHSVDVGARGQLVLPVFFDDSAENKLAGVIEYVTNDKGLKSTYMGKTIKVVYDGDMIKFRLPLSAKFTDMLREVTKRFTGLENTKFRVEYVDKNGVCLPISSDEVLQICMKDSSLKGANFIKMHVYLEHIVF